ncbi:hypothetical protein ITP53_29515 [Nonomuraea sp. K274]|uniref:Secreted protein n=1 Tax=Nonomuraea cypriaca TaxID=1187855 RepID=A0A931ABJ2_9ACTN|nr:hypothetical protein [Nonomuraea cypriaca]MBF8189796.1 hypothetical protein [Nonomuraea cypriaca]
MRSIPAVLAASAAVALALPCAAPAFAAPRGVTITSSDGHEQTFENPSRGKCYTGGFGTDSTLTNSTQGTVLIFPDLNCMTRIFLPVKPGDSRHSNVRSFMPLE